LTKKRVAVFTAHSSLVIMDRSSADITESDSTIAMLHGDAQIWYTAQLF
jgi:hypothetical protein